MKNIKKVLLVLLVIVSKFQAFGAANFGFGAPAINRSNIAPNIITSNAFVEVENKISASNNYKQLDSESNIENKIKKEKRKTESNEYETDREKRIKLDASMHTRVNEEQLEFISFQEQERKIEEDKEKEEFQKFYSMYAKEIDALIEKLQALGYPYDLAKLIIKFQESPTSDYTLYETLIHERNFRHGPLNWRCSIIPLNNGDLASCSCDLIKIWRRNYSNELYCVQILQAKHVRFAIQLRNSGDLVSMSSDEGIKIWHLNSDNTWELKQDLLYKYGHANSIIELKNGDLLTNSIGAVKLWRQDPNINWFCVKTLRQSQGVYYKTIELHNGDFVCVINRCVEIWNLGKDTQWSCIQSFELSGGAIIQLSNKDLVFASNGTINVYKNEDKIWFCNQTLQVDAGSINSIIELSNGDLAIGSGDEIRILRQNEEKIWFYLQTLRGHLGWINWLFTTDDGDLVSYSSFNKIVKIWRLTSKDNWVCAQTFKNELELIYSKDNKLFFGSFGIIEIFEKPFTNLLNISQKKNRFSFSFVKKY